MKSRTELHEELRIAIEATRRDPNFNRVRTDSMENLEEFLWENRDDILAALSPPDADAERRMQEIEKRVEAAASGMTLMDGVAVPYTRSEALVDTDDVLWLVAQLRVRRAGDKINP